MWTILALRDQVLRRKLDLMQCLHDHDAEAVGWFWFPRGCFCFEDQLQALCDYHAERSQSPYYEMFEFVYWGA
jgi:hypothetical protein